jgi:hypothetical protein
MTEAAISELAESPSLVFSDQVLCFDSESIPTSKSVTIWVSHANEEIAESTPTVHAFNADYRRQQGLGYIEAFADLASALSENLRISLATLTESLSGEILWQAVDDIASHALNWSNFIGEEHYEPPRGIVVVPRRRKVIASWRVKLRLSSLPQKKLGPTLFDGPSSSDDE